MRRSIGHLAAVVTLLVAMLVSGGSLALALSSSELSDDGEDYGWLYRRGDSLYAVEGCESGLEQDPILVLEDGLWYDPGCTRCFNAAEVQNLFNFYYADGTYTIQQRTHYALDTVMRLGGLERQNCNFSGIYGLYEDPYPRLDLLKYPSEHGVYAQDIKRVIIYAEAYACFQRQGQTPQYLDRTFEGCSNLTSIEGLEYLPTDKVGTMASMFSGCSRLEELDLSTFDTSRCTDFAGMFDGCDSLETLVLGDGWTQAAVTDESADAPLAR